MTVSYVGGAVGSNTALLPVGWEVGDIALVYAFRDGSTTNPTIPAGWISITNTADGTLCSASIGWRRLQEGDTSTGTWTNASIISLAIWRGLVPSGSPIGAIAIGAASTSNTLTYPSVNPNNKIGRSWVARFCGHRSVNVNLESPPQRFIPRAASTGANATAEVACFDSGLGILNCPAANVALTGTASGRIPVTIELREVSDDGAARTTQFTLPSIAISPDQTETSPWVSIPIGVSSVELIVDGSDWPDGTVLELRLELSEDGGTTISMITTADPTKAGSGSTIYGVGFILDGANNNASLSIRGHATVKGGVGITLDGVIRTA